jgi:hypothetical protein
MMLLLLLLLLWDEYGMVAECKSYEAIHLVSSGLSLWGEEHLVTFTVPSRTISPTFRDCSDSLPY